MQTVYLSLVAFFNGDYKVVFHKDARGPGMSVGMNAAAVVSVIAVVATGGRGGGRRRKPEKEYTVLLPRLSIQIIHEWSTPSNRVNVFSFFSY